MGNRIRKEEGSSIRRAGGKSEMRLNFAWYHVVLRTKRKLCRYCALFYVYVHLEIMTHSGCRLQAA